MRFDTPDDAVQAFSEHVESIPQSECGLACFKNGFKESKSVYIC